MKKQKTKICKQCGAENPPESKFCQSCGHKIKKPFLFSVFKWICIVIATVCTIFVCFVVVTFVKEQKAGEQKIETRYNEDFEKEISRIQEEYKETDEYKEAVGEIPSTPQLSETERAEKEQLLKEKLSKLKVIHDEFSGVDRYYSVNTPTDSQYWYYDRKTFLSPFIINIGDDYELDVISNYYGYGWLFINDVTVKIDGNFYEPYPEPLEPKFEHEVCDGGYVSENAVDSVKKLDNTITSSKYYDILKGMANGNDVVVRFSGKRGSEDLIIDKDRQAIKEVLEAWNIIEELYGK